MSRTPKRGKSPGYEFPGKRMGRGGWYSPGVDTKRRTHRAERRDGKRNTEQRDGP
jgi:hypothetical protein